MFSTSNAGRSADNLSALSPAARHEVPLHSHAQHPETTQLEKELDYRFGPLDARRTGCPLRKQSPHRPGIWAEWCVLISNTSRLIRAALLTHLGSRIAISTLLQPPIVRTGLQPHSAAPLSSAHKPPTARDIPPVTLTNITTVDASEFAPYLAQFGTLYEQLRRVKESEAEATSVWRGGRHQGEQQTESTPAGNDGLLRPGLGSSRRPRKGSNASLSSINSIEAPSPSRRSSSQSVSRKAAAQGPPPLSTIPNVYFEEDFHLENPRTFDVVSEKSEVIGPSQTMLDGKGEGNGAVVAAVPRRALATNAILQEKLSWYMDTIEVHLINSISTASTTFFTALGSLKVLHSAAADSVHRIKALRMELEALDEEIVTSGLDILHKRQRQENLRQLSDAVLQLKRIVDGVAACEALVDEGEVEKALERIDDLEMLIAGEREDDAEPAPDAPQLRNLQGAASLRGVNADIMTLRFRIGNMYENQFASVLLGDLKGHVDSVPLPEVLLRWSHAATRGKGGHNRTSTVFPSYLSNTEELKKQLTPAMVGLHRAHYLAAAAMAYRETVLREIRGLIRRPLPSSSDDDNESMVSVSTAASGRGRSGQEKSTILARNLRALGPDEAEALLSTIYVGVTETLRRLTTQNKMLLDVASSLTETETNSGIRSPSLRSPLASPQPERYGNVNPFSSGFELQEEMHKSLDVANLLGQAVDVANEKVVKVLRVRSEQVANLPLDFFLRYFTLNLYFANECEAISGRSGTPLKNVVNGHIKEFVQRTRDTEMQKLAQGMESDRWNVRDFDEGSAKLLGEIVESSTHDCEAWLERTRLWVPYHEIEKAAAAAAAAAAGQQATATATAAAEPDAKEKTRSAAIDSEKFMLPNSAVLCMEGIAKMLQLILGIPSMTSDIASSLIAYLQLFNSRCTQLILGAGATRSAGLGSITSKHLALASQALAFISTLMPHVREFVRRHAGSGPAVSSLMGEFDKVRRLLQEHQDSIHQKLVDIMSGRAAIRARAMDGIDWDAPATGAAAHAYMETLVKETSTLHRVLTKHLPDMAIHMIMGPVFASYKSQLGQALEKAEPKTPAGKVSMLTDIDFLVTKLGRIAGFDDTGDNGIPSPSRLSRPYE
ncbi:vacuolar protein sorting-associated protein 54 [Geosmithia morbida]|uniref:Vacuolar protein sorting-associated protein 54 n=1 Tax=Geosmithia morbida TaxID=1094350 RepID=A0A9P4YRT9_9HYPO|nr:vacuolar protein sorting-associated protein 54 [Geosmithia morbida]KAF4120461.1 vacuolar protein sorting-associated protein 54 [Geosmithia morbida]